MTAIELDDIKLCADTTVLLEAVNLVVERSSCTALLGASGSGKTSLLRAIAGFEVPAKGRVCLFGRNVAHIPPEERGISMLFQEPVLFPRLTVRENARVALGRGVDPNIADSRIQSLAREFEIHRELDRRIDSGLSGGERQRAALVRVFSNQREVVLLDEPLRGALNVELKWQLLHAIRNRISKDNSTTVVVTHDFLEAAYLAERIVVIHDCTVVSGSPSEIYNYPPTVGAGLVLGPGNSIKSELLGSIKARDGQFPLVIDGGTPAVRGDLDWLFFRPEKLRVQAAATGFAVTDDRFLGNVRRLRLKAPNDAEIEAQVPAEAPAMKFVTASIHVQDIVVFDPLRRRRM